jgi:hypothetical protein
MNAPSSPAEYLAADHDRLEEVFDRAVADPEKVLMPLYEEFRKGLLRHIGIEEKIVLPALSRQRGGKESPDAPRLRLDHGALVALLVPPPDVRIIRTLRSILAVHNALEEGGSGVYHSLDLLAGSDQALLLERMKNTPEVPVLPHNPRPAVREATLRALVRAGYTMLE